jgi:DNA-binding CsgD family transcriptional regulator
LDEEQIAALQGVLATLSAGKELAVLEGPVAVEGDVLLDLRVGDVRCLVVRDGRDPGARALLSPREAEIARMVSRGYTNKTIAAVLDISLWTVSTHLRRIFAKLGVSNRAAMVAIVLGEVRHPSR